MLEKSNHTLVARITRTHGVTGEVVVTAHDGFDQDVIDQDFLFVDIDGGLVPFQIENIRGNNIVKLHLSGDLDEAQRLVGANVYISNDAVEDGDELPIGALINYRVYNRNDDFGTIVDVDLTVEANPLFVIDHNDKQILIPVADELILEINPNEKFITFDLPEGLTNL